MRTCFQLLMVGLLLAASASHVFACACCAEKGEYFDTVGVIDEYEREMLGDIKYSKISELYIDAAAFETIKGLDELLKVYEASETGSELENISVTSEFSSGTWTINFRSGEASGSLSIPMPEKRGYFGADIHDGKMGGGGGPLLYKEIRMNGKVKEGTGLFSKGIAKGAEYSLVFQGRGNICNNAEDFTHWRLSVNGPDARYTFFGLLESGKSEAETADQLVSAPKFEDFPVSLWKGSKRALSLSSHPRARTFRTRLREAWSGDVNFAGNFIITYWGCGTNCLFGAVIDAKTGKVFFPEELLGMGVGLPGSDIEREPFRFRKDSNLFIFYGAMGEDADVATNWMLWEGGRFVRIANKAD
jgi:hypothetical protein